MKMGNNIKTSLDKYIFGGFLSTVACADLKCNRNIYYSCALQDHCNKMIVQLFILQLLIFRAMYCRDKDSLSSNMRSAVLIWEGI